MLDHQKVALSQFLGENWANFISFLAHHLDVDEHEAEIEAEDICQVLER